MPDIVQRVKYTVEVDTTELDSFKQKLDAVNTTVATLSTSFGQLKTNVDQGLLKSVSSLNVRLARTVTVGGNAAKALGDMTTPLAGLQTSMTSLATKFDDFNKGLKLAIDDLKKVNSELAKVKKAQQQAGDTGETTAKRTGMTWLRTFGVFQSARYTVARVFEGIKEGAQQLDLDKILGQQFANFSATIAKAQELTAGTVSKGGLTKSFALMSSFGIPMDQFAENMELVQKMAIRTGQSSEYLAESFARGISRLSPLILDNLGLQVSLGQANKEYSEQTGILIENMSKQDKTAALLNLTLKKMKDATKGVTLEVGSAAASVARMESAWDDMWMWVKERGGDVIGFFDELFQSQKSDVQQMADTINEAIAMLEPLRKGGVITGPSSLDNLKSQIEAVATYLPEAGEAVDNFTKDFRTTSAVVDKARAALEQYRATGETDLAYQLSKGTGQHAEDVLAFARAMELADNAQKDAVAIANELNTSWGNLVDPQTKLLVVQKALEAAGKRTGERFQFAAKVADESGISLWKALQGSNTELEGLEQKLINILNTAALTAKENAESLKHWEVERKIAEDRGQLAQDLYDLRNGSRMVELDMNKVMADRAPLEKALQDAVEARLKATDDSARIEATRAEIEARTKLAEQDGIRTTLQMALAADKEMLASFKAMSKEKVKEMLAVTAFQIAILKAGVAGQGDYQTKLLAELENTSKMLRDLLEKKVGGGGGGASAASIFNPDKEKIKDYADEAWLALKALWAKGRDMKDDFTEMLGGTFVPEQLRIGNFETFGVIGSTLFGSGTPADWEAQKTRINSLIEDYNKLSAHFDGIHGEGWTNDKLSAMMGQDFVAALEISKDNLEDMRKHLQQLVDMADGLDRVATAMDNIAGGFSTMYGELVGSDVSAIFSDLSASMGTFSEALRGNADAYKMTTAAIPMVRSFTQNLIKNRQAQAGVEALMQGAAAWAAFATGNVAGGAMHSAAAAMYLAVAGGVLRLPKGKSKEDKPNNSGSQVSDTKMRDIHLHFDGIIPATEAERGAMIRGFIREAERAGI